MKKWLATVYDKDTKEFLTITSTDSDKQFYEDLIGNGYFIISIVDVTNIDKLV